MVQVDSTLGGVHSHKHLIVVVRELTAEENDEWCLLAGTKPLKRPFYYECEEVFT